jgi:hypothetical protein
MPREQQTDKTVAGSTKRLASRFYQLKTGHCLTRQYLNWTWTKSGAAAQCGWCGYKTQTQEYVFKNCPEWGKLQQKDLWAEVREETGREATGSKSGISSPTRGAAERCLTSSPLRM